MERFILNQCRQIGRVRWNVDIFFLFFFCWWLCSLVVAHRMRIMCTDRLFYNAIMILCIRLQITYMTILMKKKCIFCMQVCVGEAHERYSVNATSCIVKKPCARKIRNLQKSQQFRYNNNFIVFQKPDKPMICYLVCSICVHNFLGEI